MDLKVRFQLFNTSLTLKNPAPIIGYRIVMKISGMKNKKQVDSSCWLLVTGYWLFENGYFIFKIIKSKFHINLLISN
jgi:hypothetical protein